jgi:hypothetical protein
MTTLRLREVKLAQSNLLIGAQADAFNSRQQVPLHKTRSSQI